MRLNLYLTAGGVSTVPHCVYHNLPLNSVLIFYTNSKCNAAKELQAVGTDAQHCNTWFHKFSTNIHGFTLVLGIPYNVLLMIIVNKQKPKERCIKPSSVDIARDYVSISAR